MDILVMVVFSVHVCYGMNAKKEESLAAEAVTRCLDINNDGKVSKDEALKSLARERSFDILLNNDGGRENFVLRHFKLYDLDNDSIINRKESMFVSLVYVKALKECLKGGKIKELYMSPNEQKSNDEASTTFECFDRNGNGELTRQEIMHFFKRTAYKEKLTAVVGFQNFIDRAIFYIDLDGNGSSNRHEMVNVTNTYLHMVQVCH